MKDYVKKLKFGAKCHTANAVILTAVLILVVLFFATQANYLLQAKIIFIDLIN